MKFAVIRLACFLSRQQTLCRAIAVTLWIVHGTLHSPPTCFGVVLLAAWFGKDALVDRRRLYKIAHQASPQSQVAHYHPGSSCEANGGDCAGFRTPATMIWPRAAAAGVRKAPRHEIASAGSAGRCRGLYMATGCEVKTARLATAMRREQQHNLSGMARFC